MGLEPTRETCPLACFQDRFLIQPDDFHKVARILRMRATCLFLLRPAVLSDAANQVAGAGIEPADAWVKAMHFYQQKLPRSGKRPVGVEPT